MKRDEYRTLFESALEVAAVNADEKLGFNAPRNFKVVFYGRGHSGTVMDPLTALDLLYLGDDEFFRIVDVSVIEVDENATKVFVRVSQHEPAGFLQTWNDPPGSGPFKQLIAEKIKCEENYDQ